MRLLLLLLLLPAVARAERPSAWLFRATPGFGYAWDGAPRCSVQGPAMIGGWEIGKFVTPSLMVGGALGMTMYTPEKCTDDMESPIMMGMTFGPVINWYPTTSGFHVIASTGIATIDQENKDDNGDVGIGTMLAVGYDWHWFDFKSGENARAGFLLQLTAARTTSGHATLAPALLFSTCVD